MSQDDAGEWLPDEDVVDLLPDEGAQADELLVDVMHNFLD
jgi:hypothetical protein